MPKKVVMPTFKKFLGGVVVSAVVLATGGLVPPGSVVASAGAAGAGGGIPVMGPNTLSAAQLAAWYRSTGKVANIPPVRPGEAPTSIDTFAKFYIIEGNREGVRGDLAFAQSMVETGYLGFVGSIVKPENYNYAGMGACDSCNSGRQFPNPKTGVRAQIQHLKNFADPTSRAATLGRAPVVQWYGLRAGGVLDPALAIYNFDHFYSKGTAPTWNSLGGPDEWASSPSYAEVILQVYNQMLTFNGQPGSCPADRLGFGAGEALECPVPIRQAGRAVSGGIGGYYLLNGNGSVRAVGAPFYGDVNFSWDIARDIQTTPDGHGYVVLDGWGGIHLFGSAATGPLKNLVGTYFGFDIARSLVLTADGAGYYVLDGFGGIHTAGTAHLPAGKYPYWPGWDVARSMAVTLNGAGVVVLDGYGGVSRVGTVPKLHDDYFGFDIARDIAITPAGDGYAVLDGFGGIHPSGKAPVAGDIGYATYDRWRGLAIRNGRYTAVRNDGHSVS